jgi:hypothetical protein
MATIKIIRTKEYSNLLRNYKIFIDGQSVGTIANGESKEINLTVGQHIVSSKIDWCSSPDILVDIKDNQTKILNVGAFKYGQYIMPIILGLIVLNGIMSNFVDFDYTVFLVMPMVLFLIYYLTIGRNRYLTLSELPDKAP